MFEGVWHLTDPAADAARDSTAGAHHLAAATAAERPAIATDALVAEGRAFDGNDDNLGVADDDHFDHGTDAFSFAVWVNVTQSAGLYDMPLFKGGLSDGVPGYDFELGTNTWRAYVGDGQTTYNVAFGFEAGLLGGWVHLVAVVDRPAQRLRGSANGIEVATTSIAKLGSTDSPYPLDLGGNVNGNYSFRGELDEVRVYARALPPAWIAAEYANLSSPSKVVTLGAEEAQ